jgi:hypothetical protein
VYCSKFSLKGRCITCIFFCMDYPWMKKSNWDCKPLCFLTIWTIKATTGRNKGLGEDVLF